MFAEELPQPGLQQQNGEGLLERSCSFMAETDS